MALILIAAVAAVLGMLVVVRYHQGLLRVARADAKDWEKRAGMITRLFTQWEEKLASTQLDLEDARAELERLKPAAPIVIPAGENVH